jgi:hypothetical protein
MGTPTGFHPDTERKHSGDTARQLTASEARSKHHVPGIIHADDAKHEVGDIDPDRSVEASRCARAHPPAPGCYPRRMSSGRRKKSRRTRNNPRHAAMTAAAMAAPSSRATCPIA